MLVTHSRVWGEVGPFLLLTSCHQDITVIDTNFKLTVVNDKMKAKMIAKNVVTNKIVLQKGVYMHGTKSVSQCSQYGYYIDLFLISGRYDSFLLYMAFICIIIAIIKNSLFTN